MLISERIFELMSQKSITNAQLSRATGIKTNTISDWKTKGTNPQADSIVRICECLNVTVEYLLTGKQSTTTEPNVIGSKLDEDQKEILGLLDRFEGRARTNMSPTQRMFAVLEQQGKTVTSLCSHLGIKTNVVANWKTQDTIPPSKYLVRICEFINVSVEFLLTGNHLPNMVQTLDEDQKEILGLLDKFEGRARTKFVTRCEDVAEQMLEAGDNSQIPRIS